MYETCAAFLALGVVLFRPGQLARKPRLGSDLERDICRMDSADSVAQLEPGFRLALRLVRNDELSGGSQAACHSRKRSHQ